jgi:glucose/arabinose dehydrogenase
MSKPLPLVATLAFLCALAACNRGTASDARGAAPTPGAAAVDAAAAADGTPGAADDSASPPFAIAEVTSFDEPWAMAYLPDGRLLVTEKKGHLQLLDTAGQRREVGGVPAVSYGGQGGLGDVVVHPKFAANHLVYLSYAEAGADDTRGAAVARGRLVEDASGVRLEDLRVIWRQQPKVDGGGHFGHRIAFGGDGKLWISSGERQQFDPAQDLSVNLGKILRLEDDGRVPADNPFAAQGGLAAQAWTLGHRNPLGLAFDAKGRLWELEMGPAGGDELNLIVRGANYGWPEVSEGDHYDGRDIPPHSSAPQFHAPAISWNPVIAPADMIFYSGRQFPQWNGDVLIAGLKSEALVRVRISGDHAREAARYPMGHRIREVEQAPDGAVMLLEDGTNARLLKLTGAPAGRG